MLSTAELRGWYERRLALYQALADRVNPILGMVCLERGFLYEYRVKKIESVLQKLETGRFDVHALDDIFACTIVVITAKQVQLTIDAIPPAIEIIESRTAQSRKTPPEVFRFDDTLLICKLRPSDPTLDVHDSVFQTKFELQIRTLSQHAWSKATHDLVYKSDVVAWSRIRLASQLRAVAEQCDVLYEQFESIADSLPAVESRELVLKTFVYRTLRDWQSEGLVPVESLPNDMFRLSSSISSLLECINQDENVIAQVVKHYLQTRGFPASLSMYQLWVGVLISRLLDRRLIDRFREKRVKFFVTSECLSLFPDLGRIPRDLLVQLPVV